MGLKDGRIEEATVAILTTTPNELVAPIHNRQPVILSRTQIEDVWLNPDVTELDVINQCFAPYPANEMVAIPITARVNNVRYQGADIREPVGDAFA